MEHQNQYINREISWLKFNARVLQEAKDSTVPLLERLRFIGIFSNNLDEFFKVRYANVQHITFAGESAKKALRGKDARELLEEITKVVIKQQAESSLIIDEIFKELKEHNICIIKEDQVTEKQGEFLNNYFTQKVSPALMTFMLNDIEKFPHLKDSAAYLAVKLILNKPINIESEKEHKLYSLIEIPKSVERFVVLPAGDDGKDYVMFLDDVIRYCLDQIFNIFDYRSANAHMIKITRDAQLDIDNDFKKSFIEKISKSVQLRRQGDPVRFVYDQKIDKDTLDFLMKKMHINDTDSIIPGGRYHNRRDYMSFPTLNHKELTYKSMPPLPIPQLDLSSSLFKAIAKKDYLMYAPYHSFSYVIKFLREAALDINVKSIKITIYRLSKVSHIASSLINAAKNGKEVIVQIELQARFDEENNIRYAEILQRAGVKLIFGVPGLKVHCKTCVVERIEKGKVKRYGFISTGNFNESTAKVYTDYTLFTSNTAILKDINKVFNFFETNYKVSSYKHILVSPHYTRKKLIKLVDKEIKQAKEGKEAYIRLKVNSLSDYPMIDKLYEASNAGVKIDLIVRGICCLIPGVKGMSENIKAISVIDKFLEHPRLYIFGNQGNPLVYISSADWMTRNLDRRVEVSCPILDQEIKQELIETFDICWKDNVKARILNKTQDNSYVINDLEKNRSQITLYKYYEGKIKKVEKVKAHI